jgi:DNA polymerase
MEGRQRVLGPANGSPDARILFVGEAPGRHGAERTGIPFYGDASGRRFEMLLREAGWQRSDVFVTNAVLCNPQDGSGRNRPPRAAELAHCRAHLAATVELVAPLLTVALGRRALAALAAVAPHAIDASTIPGELLPWRGAAWIAWLVHPSPLTQTRRSFETQRADWLRLRASVDRLLLSY